MWARLDPTACSLVGTPKCSAENSHALMCTSFLRSADRQIRADPLALAKRCIDLRSVGSRAALVSFVVARRICSSMPGTPGSPREPFHICGRGPVGAYRVRRGAEPVRCEQAKAASHGHEPSSRQKHVPAHRTSDAGRTPGSSGWNRRPLRRCRLPGPAAGETPRPFRSPI